MSDETMTDIDKLAMEIVTNFSSLDGPFGKYELNKAVCIGILEGMKLQRERDAVIAEAEASNRQMVIDHMPHEKNLSYSRGGIAASVNIAAAIRSAL